MSGFYALRPACPIADQLQLSFDDMGNGHQRRCREEVESIRIAKGHAPCVSEDTGSHTAR